MKLKAFVTGINGQDGSYLTELLLSKNYEVHGVIRRCSSFNTSRIDHLINNPEIFNKTLFLYHGDISDAANMIDLISKIKPDELYNLAAMSHVAVSFSTPIYVANVDAIGTANILEAVRQQSPHTKIYQASSSELFGGIKENMNSHKGFSENSKLCPASPYGCAKLYSYWMTKVYRESYKIFASNGLLFNHESPRRGETFVSRKITIWFAKYWKNLQKNIKTPPLLLGNLNSFRDWSHSKDCVYAQWLILQHNKPDDFVISSGETHSIREFVETCFTVKNKKIEWIGSGLEEIGMCDGEIVIKIDPKYFRPMEVDYLLGDCEKSKKELGWIPTYTFEQLVKEMVESDINN